MSHPNTIKTFYTSSGGRLAAAADTTYVRDQRQRERFFFSIFSFSRERMEAPCTKRLLLLCYMAREDALSKKNPLASYPVVFVVHITFAC